MLHNYFLKHPKSGRTVHQSLLVNCSENLKNKISVGLADCETDQFESSNDHKGKVKSVAFIKGSQKDTDF